MGLQKLGSSPRVLGQVELIDDIGELERIIPTRVGTSYFESKGKLNSWDHPHACGDKTVLSKVIGVLLGSSPRVWGQVVHLS